MDKRINKKLESYIAEFKNDIRAKADELNITDEQSVTELLTYIFDYNKLTFNKDDFMKRKRNKLGINNCERCIAKRSDGEQCTRRKKTGGELCGTHVKGIPHGVCEILDVPQENNTNIVEVKTYDINGIMYFIDLNNNVYQTEDVLLKKINPKIIGRLIENEAGELEVSYTE